MKTCSLCGMQIVNPHRTDKDCMFAIVHEVGVLSSRLIFFLNHKDNDCDISKDIKELKDYFKEILKFLDLFDEDQQTR